MRKQRNATRAAHDEDHDISDLLYQEVGIASTSRFRIVDWLRAGSLTIAVPLCGLLAMIFLDHLFKSETVTTLTFLATLVLFPLTILTQFRGFLFDGPNDRLSYPVYFYRRSIPISEIRDANCQTVTQRYASNAGRVIGEGPTSKRTKRIYAVNISGDFGVRNLRFGAKYKRDQFLSGLRHIAPHCRITRWT